MPISDPEARRAYHRDYMRNRYANDVDHKEAHLAAVKAYKAKLLAANRKIIAKAKNVGCKNCNETDHACLDFHHIDPSSKAFGIGTQARSVTSEKLKLEIAKCVVVCANCHRKLHKAEWTGGGSSTVS